MDTQSIIPQSDDRLFSYFLKEFLAGLFGGTDPFDNRQTKRKELSAAILLGLLLIVATEPLKVILRKNIGKLSYSFPRLATACFFYLLFGVILYFIQEQPVFENYKTALLAGGIFDALFAVVVFILGMIEHMKGAAAYNQNPDDTLKHLHRGDSVFFGHLLAKGVEQKKIWLISEPLLCFLFALATTVLPAFIHPILMTIGAPYLITALSFWLNETFQIKNVWNIQSKRIAAEKMKAEHRRRSSSEEGFSSVTMN